MPAPALLLGQREASEQACGFHSLQKGSARLASPAVFVVTHFLAHACGQEEAVEAHEPGLCAGVPSAGPRVPAGLEAPAPPRPPGRSRQAMPLGWVGLHVQALRPPCGSAWS